MNEEIRNVFRNESQSFFSERLKWKTDVARQMEEQDNLIKKIDRISNDNNLRINCCVDSVSSLIDTSII